MENPFSLNFGMEPVSIVERGSQKNEIIGSFSALNPPYQVCMITGVRGSGKTVLMTEISKYFKQNKDWVVIDLSPERDILRSLAAALANKNELISLFKDAKINLSFLGFGIEIDGIPPITDMSIAISKMLDSLKKHGKRVLITLDEVTNNQFVKEFSSMVQIYMRDEYPIFLLMTGLYENIYELQNEKSLTFLYRAPKIELKSLNITGVASKYQSIFKLTDEKALLMAKETYGYPFAFQVLGYLCFKNNKNYNEIIPEYCQYLDEYVYEKMWSELSTKDKNILVSLANTKGGCVDEIRKNAKMNSSYFGVYRDRLLKKGIILSSGYGHLNFALPRFKEFVLTQIF